MSEADLIDMFSLMLIVCAVGASLRLKRSIDIKRSKHAANFIECTTVSTYLAIENTNVGVPKQLLFFSFHSHEIGSFCHDLWDASLPAN